MNSFSDHNEQIIARIKTFAEEQRFSLRELSAALGRSRTYLSTYFQKGDIPPRRVLEQLEQVGADLGWILTGVRSADSRTQPVTNSIHQPEVKSMDDPFLSDLWNQVTSILPGVPSWDQLDEEDRRGIIAAVGVDLLQLHEKVKKPRKTDRD